jgi:vacuolar iron transporter family protein
MPQKQFHHAYRTGWLRAAVLGADDGIVSTTSLILGVAAAHSTRGQILLAAVAGLVAGAMAMAAGEYVSVSSQRDAERADLALERKSLAADQNAECDELAAIYVERGLEPTLAAEVARQFMAHDALHAHARDELGLESSTRARPIQAASVSAASFASGAFLPLMSVSLAPTVILAPLVAAISLVTLALLGAFAARAGGAPVARGSVRVLFWGALAMLTTYSAGSLFGPVP